MYRLENEGVKTILDELEEYSKNGILTFAEWAEFSEGEIPLDRLDIQIEYVDETERNFIFSAYGKTPFINKTHLPQKEINFSFYFRIYIICFRIKPKVSRTKLRFYRRIKHEHYLHQNH